MWNNLLIALEIMGKGMGGIFVVVLICKLLKQAEKGGSFYVE